MYSKKEEKLFKEAVQLKNTLVKSVHKFGLIDTLEIFISAMHSIRAETVKDNDCKYSYNLCQNILGSLDALVRLAEIEETAK